MTLKGEAWVVLLFPLLLVLSLPVGVSQVSICTDSLCATAARAFKSVLQGILLSSEGEKLNSMNLLLYMSPIAIVVLLPAALVMEPDVIDVLGNAKGAVAVVISILLFRNPVTFVGIGGYTMTVMGVVAYGEAKRRYQ